MMRTLALTGAAGITAAAALLGAPVASAAPTAPTAPTAPPAPPASAATGWLATLKPITANHVTGSGTGWITLTGRTADLTLQVSGLIDAPHPANIRIDGAGTCPTQPAEHAGNQSISLNDGVPAYGKVGTSLTTTGDTSPASVLAIDRFPSAGNYTFRRSFDLDDTVLANLRKGTAVLVVHGVDYNGNGKYDAVLGTSELSGSLPAEATDPALCAAFVPAQMPAVPTGSADTGGGSAAATAAGPGLWWAGGAALVGAVVLGGAAARRRPGSVTSAG